VLSGKYELLGLLGQGGMGVVYAGRHLKLGRRVAIKTLKTDTLVDPDACLRFEREARAAASLKSRYVASVEDVDTLADGTPYMVMELLEGRSLDAVLDERGRLEASEAVEFVLHACSALQEAHLANIVHRDIKPANLFVASEGGDPVIKVLDFGISKLVDGDDKRVTQTGLALGTPMYMSPEQIRSSRTVDHRSDIWSLGVVLYESLTGRPPFDGASAASVIAAITADDPMPPHEVEPDIPEALSAVVMKALAKRADRRYASIAEFGVALQPFTESFRFAPSGPAPAPAGTSSDATTTRQVGHISLSGDASTTRAEMPTRPIHRSDFTSSTEREPVRARVAVAVAVGLLVLGGVVIASRRSSQAVAERSNATTTEATESGAATAELSAAAPSKEQPPMTASAAPESTGLEDKKVASSSADPTSSSSPRDATTTGSASVSSASAAPPSAPPVSSAAPSSPPGKRKPVGGDGYLFNL